MLNLVSDAHVPRPPSGGAKEFWHPTVSGRLTGRYVVVAARPGGGGQAHRGRDCPAAGGNRTTELGCLIAAGRSSRESSQRPAEAAAAPGRTRDGAGAMRRRVARRQ